jgi:hypothetical protein
MTMKNEQKGHFSFDKDENTLRLEGQNWVT